MLAELCQKELILARKIVSISEKITVTLYGEPIDMNMNMMKSDSERKMHVTTTEPRGPGLEHLIVGMGNLAPSVSERVVSVLS